MISQVSALRIAIFNIQSGVGTTKGNWQYITSFWKYLLPHSNLRILEATKFINNENLDLIGFSEIDFGSFRAKDQTIIISNNTDLKYKSFFSAVNLFGIMNHGNSIHSRYKILSSKNIRLPGGGEPRSLGKAVIDINGINLTVFVTHLSLNKNVRKNQIKEVYKIVNKTANHVILMGDFNVENDSELDIMSSDFIRVNYKDYPSWNPDVANQYIFLSKDLKLNRSYILNEAISDHLPLIAEIEFRTG